MSKIQLSTHKMQVYDVVESNLASKLSMSFTYFPILNSDYIRSWMFIQLVKLAFQ